MKIESTRKMSQDLRAKDLSVRKRSMGSIDDVKPERLRPSGKCNNCYLSSQPETVKEVMEMKSEHQAENGEKDCVSIKNNTASVKIQRYAQIFLAEFIATALLMFMVCMGCMNGITKDPINPLQSGLTSGFAVASLVQIFGHVSDCHMNPAVTAFFWSIGKIDISTSVVYVVAELLGATCGVGILRAVIPQSILDGNPGHCETNPHADISYIQAAIFEFIITSFLMFLICGLLDIRNSAKQDSSPVKFAFAIIAISYAGGSLTGASLNPARSFAPSLWNGSWSGHWVYWVGPMSAGFIVPKIYKFLFEKDLTVSDSDK